ncbi:MAG: DUF1893 domain-containing protein [Anaerolineae bacterium]
MKSDLQLAKDTLRAQNLSFVLAKAGRVMGASSHPGIGDLLRAVEALGEETRGAALADKVVGKAVAMVARYAGIAAVYASLTSEAARTALAAGGISLEYDQLVPLILNQQGTGSCPLERLTSALDDPQEAVAALRAFVTDEQPPGQSKVWPIRGVIDKKIGLNLDKGRKRDIIMTPTDQITDSKGGN